MRASLGVEKENFVGYQGMSTVRNITEMGSDGFGLHTWIKMAVFIQRPSH